MVTVLWLCPSLPTETLKWLSSLPILMQVSFWWWQCSDRYIISLFPHFHAPFFPSLISLMVSVDVKNHVYFIYGIMDGLSFGVPQYHHSKKSRNVQGLNVYNSTSYQPQPLFRKNPTRYFWCARIVRIPQQSCHPPDTRCNHLCWHSQRQAW